MFEDSTFESTGRIRTRSRGWMMATFSLNVSILLALVLIPLIYPEALPQHGDGDSDGGSAARRWRNPSRPFRPVHAQATQSQIHAGVLQAPTMIPDKPWIPSTQEEPVPVNVAALGDGGNARQARTTHSTGAPRSPMCGKRSNRPQHVSSGVMTGYLIYKVVPRLSVHRDRYAHGGYGGAAGYHLEEREQLRICVW